MGFRRNKLAIITYIQAQTSQFVASKRLDRNRNRSFNKLPLGRVVEKDWRLLARKDRRVRDAAPIVLLVAELCRVRTQPPEMKADRPLVASIADNRATSSELGIHRVHISKDALAHYSERHSRSDHSRPN